MRIPIASVLNWWAKPGSSEVEGAAQFAVGTYRSGDLNLVVN